MKTLPPLLESGNTRTLAALKIRNRDLDSRKRKELALATVKVAMAELHARERARVFQRFRSAHARGGEKEFL